MKATLDEARADAPSVEHVVVWRRLGVRRPAAAGRDVSWDELLAAQPATSRRRGRLGAPVPAHLHVRHDRPAEGRRPRPGRLPRLDRARGRLPGRRAPWRPHPLRHRHGLDHGPVDGGRRRRDGRDDRLRGGRARLAGRPPLAARRGGARVDPRLLADAHPRAHPARRARDATSRRSASSSPPASRGTPTRTAGSSSDVGGGRCPIINCSGGTEVGACFLSPTPAEPIKECSVGVPALGHGDGRRRRRGPVRCAGEVGELVCRKPFPGMTRGLLARPRALPRHVLAPLPGHLDARRLGVRRRGRLLVPARPLGRHAEHRRQAHRAGRARVGRGRAPRRRRGGGGRHPARGEGRGGVGLLRARRRDRAERRAGRARCAARRRRARQGVRARARRLRARPAEDAQRKIVRRAVRARRSATIPATCPPSRTPRRWTRSQMSSDLAGQVALITGGGRGIGRYVALELAEAGMKVAVSARTRSQVEETAAEIGGLAIEADVSQARGRRAHGRRDRGAARAARPARRERRRHGGLGARGRLGGRSRRVVARVRGERARRLPHRPGGHPGDARARRAAGS